MKRINITISDEVWADLKTHVAVRGLVQASYTASDAFVVKLVECIEKGLEEKHFHYVPRSDDETK